MLKIRREAADQVAEGLFAAEAAMEAAVVSVANLVALMPGARRHANLSAVVGSDPAFRVIACLKSLGDASQQLVEAHHGLATTQRQVGLGAVAYGETGKPDDDAMVAPPTGSLRVAA